MSCNRSKDNSDIDGENSNNKFNTLQTIHHVTYYIVFNLLKIE